MTRVGSLSIVFPAYNEGSKIARTLEQALKVAADNTSDFEIVVVNDGSKDNTEEVVKSYQKKDFHIRLINHAQNKGYGQTVWDGLKAAKKDWVFFADSDLQFDLAEVKNLLAKTDQADVIIGYRSPRRDPFMRLVNAKSWNVLNRLLFGLKVKDIDCAFKLFRRQVLTDIEVQSGGAAFSAELLMRLKKKGLDFVEVPVSHFPRQVGSASTGAHPRVIIRAFKELFGLYRTTDLGRPFYREMIKFGLVGTLSTTVDFAILNLLFLVLKANLYVATFGGFLAGSINGYVLNNVWTYHHHRLPTKASGLARYTVIGLVGLGITEGIIDILSVKGQLNYNLAKLTAVVVVFFWNFFANRLWTFKPNE